MGSQEEKYKKLDTLLRNTDSSPAKDPLLGLMIDKGKLRHREAHHWWSFKSAVRLAMMVYIHNPSTGKAETDRRVVMKLAPVWGLGFRQKNREFKASVAIS